MQLGALLAGVADQDLRAPEGSDDIEITAVAHDTRAAVPGTLFCCVPGVQVDGHDLAPEAQRLGAVALVVEHPVAAPLPQIVVPSVRRAMGPIAAAFWGQPSRRMTVVGVTGTSGKTTTTHLLAAIAEVAGRPTETIGTLSGPRTTPEAPDLQASLAAALTEGRSTVSMEVSSHALTLGRVRGTHFAVAVFTNLSHDHLDFHRDLEDYFAAKAQLFQPEYAARAVVNLDDAHGRRLAADPAIPTEGFGVADATDLEVGPDRCRFTWRGEVVSLPLGGMFNVSNALAAATAAAAIGVTPAQIAAGLGGASPVPGRFEPIDVGQPFTVLVDYAHKPGALENALSAARHAARGGRVFVVFGAGGDRDTSKRPAMGEVAGRLADRVLLTSDNPRGEDPLAIIEAVRSGIARNEGLTIEPDRAAAIALALSEASVGDVVVIAGRGHETIQVVGDRSFQFDDRKVARAELLRLAGERRW